ncbi:MAG: hypothetical protein OXC91_10035 [Rhodobacteraceae bacterium]|nr:hypothetical protein [Paracoccaceae bacterium]
MRNKGKIVEAKKKILKRNHKIDSSVVNAHEALENRFKDAGVTVKSEYKLEPPLGRGKRRLLGGNF